MNPSQFQSQQQQGGEVLIYAFLGIVGLFLILWVATKIFAWRTRITVRDTKAREEIARVELEAMPKCCCGEVATEPAPFLKRSRGAGDWLRSIYGAPPRYKRVVDQMQQPALCKVHAHVADAMLDQFIFNRVRAAYSDLNAKVAIEAAAFEQEALLVQLTASLTDTQKRAQRKSTPNTVLRMLPAQGSSARTGTDGDEG